MKKVLVPIISFGFVLAGCAAARLSEPSDSKRKNGEAGIGDFAASTPAPQLAPATQSSCSVTEILRRVRGPIQSYLTSSSLNYRDPKITEIYPFPGGLDRGQEEAYVIVSTTNASTSQRLFVRIAFSFAKCSAGQIVGAYPLDSVQ